MLVAVAVVVVLVSTNPLAIVIIWTQFKCLRQKKCENKYRSHIRKITNADDDMEWQTRCNNAHKMCLRTLTNNLNCIFFILPYEKQSR